MEKDIAQFMRSWSNDRDCVTHIMERKYPGLQGICPECGAWTNFSVTNKRTSYTTHCQMNVSALRDTPFYLSNLPLPYWFLGIYIYTNYPDWISIRRLSRLVGISYVSAQRMLVKLRDVDDPGQWIR